MRKIYKISKEIKMSTSKDKIFDKIIQDLPEDMNEDFKEYVKKADKTIDTILSEVKKAIGEIQTIQENSKKDTWEQLEHVILILRAIIIAFLTIGIGKEK